MVSPSRCPPWQPERPGPIGGIALAGASYAERGHGGMGFFAKGQFALMAMEIIDSIDTDGDGKLSQAEIDKVRDDRHAAHDGDSDGNLSLDEFAGVWHETTRPLTVAVGHGHGIVVAAVTLTVRSKLRRCRRGRP